MKQQYYALLSHNRTKDTMTLEVSTDYKRIDFSEINDFGKDPSHKGSFRYHAFETERDMEKAVGLFSRFTILTNMLGRDVASLEDRGKEISKQYSRVSFGSVNNPQAKTEKAAFDKFEELFYDHKF